MSIVVSSVVSPDGDTINIYTDGDTINIYTNSCRIELSVAEAFQLSAHLKYILEALIEDQVIVERKT